MKNKVIFTIAAALFWLLCILLPNFLPVLDNIPISDADVRTVLLDYRLRDALITSSASSIHRVGVFAFLASALAIGIFFVRRLKKAGASRRRLIPTTAIVILAGVFLFLSVDLHLMSPYLCILQEHDTQEHIAQENARLERQGIFRAVDTNACKPSRITWMEYLSFTL
jgi:hypothetical protein